MTSILWRARTRLMGASVGLASAALLTFSSGSAQAVPAFANQTGQNCVACHAGGVYPELTPYGRAFKLTGYTFGERNFPLSVMGVATYNKTKNTDETLVGGDSRADFPKDGNLIFNTASLFLAGKITDHIGGFVQVTYNNYDSQSATDSHWKGHSTSDNLDIRFTDRLLDANRDLIFGITLNNNPSVQDVWNSAPAWGFNVVPGSSGPNNTPLLAGGLAQNVAGIGAYAYWNKTFYAELSGYRTANGVFSFMSQGFHTDLGNQAILKGVNPYWRIAYTKEWGAQNIMIGTMGLVADQYDDPTNPSGPNTHRFRDVGVDAQYQYLLDPHTVTTQVSYIREKHRYPANVANQIDPNGIGAVLADGVTSALVPTNNSDTLNMFRAKATYVYQAKYGGSLSYFNSTGSSNSLNQTSAFDVPTLTQLGSGGVGGNASGSPATTGWTPEVFWTPIQYARIGLQYTNYTKFNGASTNYDGFGRNAKDNNTIFLYVWGVY